ncbi:hypothetical protein A2903_02065 [Candidatus Nomurabacteria bacterium RIFCSPLOWO2_01_FULL_33_17]|uniref:RNA polymerase alpha subunit C-terminal domain-containing protein n=1 Tax=Candidatus Nomurabacteria bacterium RIFCSPLOWO2_01_FULL_33_17 TaxID=1801764 RepID=A0A1F6WQB4_9BACT|nr:MAG: hypothetical protein A2903_02065 [Candidatus Nomurabacteria bacterium RIFCSPLOWO2_01_FULL_33_17]
MITKKFTEKTVTLSEFELLEILKKQGLVKGNDGIRSMKITGDGQMFLKIDFLEKEEEYRTGIIYDAEKLLKTEIRDLPITTRTQNKLKANEIKNLGELIDWTLDDLCKIPGLGKHSLYELERFLIFVNLKFKE